MNVTTKRKIHSSNQAALCDFDAIDDDKRYNWYEVLFCMKTSAKYCEVPFNTSDFSYKDNKHRIEYYRGRLCFEKI